MSSVSVIVVNYNRGDLLGHCLRSLVNQTYDKTDILVVDNGSTDHSREVVRSFESPSLRLVALSENVGFAAGCNAGIARASGSFVALLNNDAVAHPNWLAALVSAAEERPEVGMVASKILLHGTRTIDKAGHLIYPDGQNRGRGTGDRDRGQFDLLGDTLFPDGCAALYRMRLLREVSGFDEDFFAYADDADLGLRARWMGWECLYAPEAVVEHRHSSTSGPYSSQKVYWVERNRYWLAVKNLPWPLLVLMPLTTVVRWCWNAIAAFSGKGSAGNFMRDSTRSKLAAAVAKAQLDGLKGTRRMWRKRRELRKRRKVSDLEFLRLLWKYRVSARTLAFRDVDSRSE